MASLAVRAATSPCVRCGQPTPVARASHARRKYCEACNVVRMRERWDQSNRQRRAKVIALRPPRPCVGCGQDLPRESRSDRRWCGSCRHVRRIERSVRATREYRRREPEYYAAAYRKWRMGKYGLTIEQANIMLADGCAVCGTMEKLRIDHNHATGKTRGVLCQSCNSALGMAHDKPEILRALAGYLEERDG
jgi:hypothetical protein